MTWEYGNLTPAELISDLAQKMAAIYGAHEQRLLRAVARQITATTDEPMSQAEALATLRRISQEVARRIRAETAQQALTTAQIAAREGALSAFMQLTGQPLGAGLAATSTVPGAAATAAIAVSMATVSADLANRVLRYAPDVYQQVVGAAATGTTLGLDTSAQAQANAWGMLRQQGINNFVDKSGRKWNLASYVEMSTRAAVQRAYTDAATDQAVEMGHDLFIVIGTGNACPHCSPWFGKILTKTGVPGKRVVESGVTGNPITITVHDTVAAARKAKWQHPNCRCRLAAWIPGTKKPGSERLQTHDQYKAEQQLRGVERHIRAAKRAEAGALTDADRKQQTAKISALENRAAALVRANGLQRQKRREAIDLGNDPTTTPRNSTPQRKQLS